MEHYWCALCIQANTRWIHHVAAPHASILCLSPPAGKWTCEHQRRTLRHLFSRFHPYKQDKQMCGDEILNAFKNIAKVFQTFLNQQWLPTLQLEKEVHAAAQKFKTDMLGNIGDLQRDTKEPEGTEFWNKRHTRVGQCTPPIDELETSFSNNLWCCWKPIWEKILSVNYQRSASESNRALNSSHNLWENGWATIWRDIARTRKWANE